MIVNVYALNRKNRSDKTNNFFCEKHLFIHNSILYQKTVSETSVRFNTMALQ